MGRELLAGHVSHSYCFKLSRFDRVGGRSPPSDDSSTKLFFGCSFACCLWCCRTGKTRKVQSKFETMFAALLRFVVGSILTGRLMGGVWLAMHRHKQHFEDEFVLTARHEVPCDWFRRKSFSLQLMFQEQFGADKQDLARYRVESACFAMHFKTA